MPAASGQYHVCCDPDCSCHASHSWCQPNSGVQLQESPAAWLEGILFQPETVTVSGCGIRSVLFNCSTIALSNQSSWLLSRTEIALADLSAGGRVRHNDCLLSMQCLADINAHRYVASCQIVCFHPRVPLQVLPMQLHKPLPRQAAPPTAATLIQQPMQWPRRSAKPTYLLLFSPRPLLKLLLRASAQAMHRPQPPPLLLLCLPTKPAQFRRPLLR